MEEGLKVWCHWACVGQRKTLQRLQPLLLMWMPVLAMTANIYGARGLCKVLYLHFLFNYQINLTTESKDINKKAFHWRLN